MDQEPLANLDHSSQVTYQDFDNWLIEQARALPTPRGDRNAQKQAAGEQQQGSQQAQLLAQEAQGLYGPLTGFAQNMMTNPQGFGSAYPGMVATAGAAGAGTAATANAEAARRAAATGNIAGLSGTQDANVQAASRGTTQTLNDLAVANQQLKNQQQFAGADIMKGIYGENLGASTADLNASINATNAFTEAGKSGWYQNLLAGLGTAAGMGTGAGSMMTGLYGSRGALGT